MGTILSTRSGVLFLATIKNNAAQAGFDDAFIYDELTLPFSKRRIPFEQIEREAALKTFKYWDLKEDKIQY